MNLKRDCNPQFVSLKFLFVALAFLIGTLHAQSTAPAHFLRLDGWKMQDATQLPSDGSLVSQPSFSTAGWYPATVPGTVLTTLVDNHVYPDPNYGENDRPEVIPESLARTPFWYRTVVAVPHSFRGRHIWLTFEGINYSAEVWANGTSVGNIRGAFGRGIFDISPLLHGGSTVTIAVLVRPQPHPGVPHEHTLSAGMGKNGGVTAIDGPTFLSTIGWDWLPAQRDRDSGIWREVTLSETGSIILRDPFVTTDLQVPGMHTAAVTVQATVMNVSDAPQRTRVSGAIEGVTFERTVDLAPHSATKITFSPQTDAALLLHDPKLWWPNGYGPQNIYHLHLSAKVGRRQSDEANTTFGIRKITYAIKGTTNLGFVVNGVPIFIRGGDWGLDDAMKRIPLQRMDAEIRMHRDANLNMIRNWVGQSTSEQFYELCDKYGLLVWDEFFQPNPLDGPDPEDIGTYLANVKDKVVRFRNHPSIAIWCARNEGDPPKELDTALRSLLAEVDGTRAYQANSADGAGVRSGGPYFWREPKEFYGVDAGLKTESGSMSIPTIESIQGMMPQKDWETITDDWAEHDFAAGAQAGSLYPGVLAARYGKIRNLADFVAKSQLANYEAFRAMYEGRNADMFHPATGIITWMSHPAHPSFVWQLYHYDLEQNSSFYAVKSASEMIHVQFNEAHEEVEVVNNLPEALRGAEVKADVFNLDGSLSSHQTFAVSVDGSSIVDLGKIGWHRPSDVHFIQLQLHDASGKLLSQNFYWHRLQGAEQSFEALARMPKVTLEAKVTRADMAGKTTLEVTLHNPSNQIALMTHLQVHCSKTGERVLPAFYSDNYISIAGGQSSTVTIMVDTQSLHGESASVLVDGVNVDINQFQNTGASIGLNHNAQVDHWPETGLPFQPGDVHP
jgi:hypothetical protein